MTYKTKVLLMYKGNGPIDEKDHQWCFIGGHRAKNESFEAALYRMVEKEMGIQIENIEPVSDLYYHASLTDDNVNKIERGENQILAFFSLKEIQKLFLSSPTQEFISKYGFEEMEALFAKN